MDRCRDVVPRGEGDRGGESPADRRSRKRAALPFAELACTRTYPTEIRLATEASSTMTSVCARPGSSRVAWAAVVEEFIDAIISQVHAVKISAATSQATSTAKGQAACNPTTTPAAAPATSMRAKRVGDLTARHPDGVAVARA